MFTPSFYEIDRREKLTAFLVALTRVSTLLLTGRGGIIPLAITSCWATLCPLIIVLAPLPVLPVVGRGRGRWPNLPGLLPACDDG